MYLVEEALINGSFGCVPENTTIYLVLMKKIK
jgi:hypothetical protein